MLVVKVQHGEDTDANVVCAIQNWGEANWSSGIIPEAQKCEAISGKAIYRYNKQARCCYTVGTSKYHELLFIMNYYSNQNLS